MSCERLLSQQGQMTWPVSAIAEGEKSTMSGSAELLFTSNVLCLYRPLKQRPALFLDVVMPSGLCASIIVHLSLTVTGYNNGHTVKGNSLCPLVSPH